MKYSNLHVGQVKGHTYDIKFLPMNQIRLAHSQDNSLIGTPLSMFEPLRSCNHDTLPTSCVLILIIGAFLFQSVLILIVHVGVSALINSHTCVGTGRVIVVSLCVCVSVCLSVSLSVNKFLVNRGWYGLPNVVI